MNSQQFRRAAIAGSVCVAIGILVYSMGAGPSSRETKTNRIGPNISVVRVAAAADLKSSMDDLIAAFHRQRADIFIEDSFGSSGTLFAQLVNHAPFDLFMSADVDYPHRLIEQKLAPAESMFTYAAGRIVVWVPESSPIDVRGLGEKSFLDRAVRKIAIANPRYAPYGRAAEAALRKLGVYEQIKDKIVLGDNIGQTAQFVQTRAADIGVISKSQAMALGDAGRFWEIPTAAYPKIEQGGVILAWAKDPSAAQAFRAFVIGAEGQALLRGHGFAAPEE
jgi:molybdate transport system substrate-binding protein